MILQDEQNQVFLFGVFFNPEHRKCNHLRHALQFILLSLESSITMQKVKLLTKHRAH